MAKVTNGGGIKSRNNVKPPVKTGQPRQGMRPQAIGQVGVAIDPAASEPMLTRAYNSGVKLGNEKALDVGKGGPGAGYAQHGKSGMQGCHGPVNSGMAEAVPSRSPDVLNGGKGGK